MTMSEISNFQVLDAMCDENKRDAIALCPDFVSAQKTKNGGHVTMGVPAEVFDWLFNNTHSFKLLVINNEDFKRVKERLTDEKNIVEKSALFQE